MALNVFKSFIRRSQGIHSRCGNGLHPGFSELRVDREDESIYRTKPRPPQAIIHSESIKCLSVFRIS